MTILAATDGSPAANAALELALSLAQRGGDRILLVTVWRELRGAFGLPLPGAAEIERTWALETVGSAAARAAWAGVGVETFVRHGTAAREICAVARERRASLVAIGSHGLGAVERAVLDHAPCPVLVVPDEERP